MKRRENFFALKQKARRELRATGALINVTPGALVIAARHGVLNTVISSQLTGADVMRAVQLAAPSLKSALGAP